MRLLIISIFSLLILTLSQLELEAIGGRGGGFRGSFGGAGRSEIPRGDLNREQRPENLDSSMSRDKTLDAASERRGNESFEEGRSATHSQIQQFLQSSPVSRAQTKRDIPTQNWNDIGENIRNRVNTDVPNKQNWFQSDFWQSHPGHYPFKEDANWWRRASWNNVNDWLDDDLYGAPLYYYDGYGYPQDNASQNETNNSQATSDQEQTTTQPTGDWLPLGVFALTTDAKDAPTPQMYMQLAVNKSGELAGNLYDTKFNKTFPLVGKVDPKKQIAVWTMSKSENSPFYQTGLYNLTKNETPVRITYADDSVQNSLLIRIKDPKNSTQGQ